MRVGIVGYGHVGKAMHGLFKDAVIYDEPLGMGSKEEINDCYAAFVCVPTPQDKDGKCDTSIVESVLDWLDTKIIILRSTVRVGFTDEMSAKYHKNIVFQPEYYGETTAHPFADLNNRNWLAFGGTQEAIDLAIKTYQQVINSNVTILQSSAKDVEFAKYMENAFLATKVMFCNEMYDLADKLGVSYNQAREIWTADPRIGKSHTFIYAENRGYGGSCLPKDVNSIIYQADEVDSDMTMLKAVREKNKIYRK